MSTEARIALGVFLLIMVVVIGSLYVRSTSSFQEVRVSAPVVEFENGVQVLRLTVKEGFSPRVIEAKAGVASRLDFLTHNTYDCSASVLIPSLGYEKMLEPTGVASVSIPPEKATGIIDGTCGMGMFPFQIVFR